MMGDFFVVYCAILLAELTVFLVCSSWKRLRGAARESRP